MRPRRALSSRVPRTVGGVGRSPSADFLHDDLDAGQQIFGGGGDVAAPVVYVYGEQVLDNGRVDIAAGWMPVGTYFAGSPLYCDFLNVIFCGHPHPLPIYPAEPKWRPQPGGPGASVRRSDRLRDGGVVSGESKLWRPFWLESIRARRHRPQHPPRGWLEAELRSEPPARPLQGQLRRGHLL